MNPQTTSSMVIVPMSMEGTEYEMSKLASVTRYPKGLFFRDRNVENSKPTSWAKSRTTSTRFQSKSEATAPPAAATRSASSCTSTM